MPTILLRLAVRAQLAVSLWVGSPKPMTGVVLPHEISLIRREIIHKTCVSWLSPCDREL